MRVCLKEMSSRTRAQLSDADRKIRARAQAKTHNRAGYLGDGMQRGLGLSGLLKKCRSDRRTPNHGVPDEHRNRERSRDI